MRKKNATEPILLFGHRVYLEYVCKCVRYAYKSVVCARVSVLMCPLKIWFGILCTMRSRNYIVVYEKITTTFAYLLSYCPVILLWCDNLTPTAMTVVLLDGSSFPLRHISYLLSGNMPKIVNDVIRPESAHTHTHAHRKREKFKSNNSMLKQKLLWFHNNNNPRHWPGRWHWLI